MGDDRVAETGAGAGAEVDDALGHAGLFEKFDELRGDGGGIARRLQDDGVAADDGGERHSGHDRAWEIPRRNYRADSERDVMQRVMLSGQLDWRLRFREAQRLARVELTEVDGLGDVGVGLSPVLADFENEPCHVFHFALAEEIADAEDESGALFDGGAAPGLEGVERSLYCGLHVFFASLLMDADDLRRLRRVQRLDLLGSLDAFAADDEVVLASQLGADFGDGGAHAARVLFVAEIIKGLGDEWAGVQARARPDGRF